MSEKEVIKQIKDMIIAFDVQGYVREKGFIKEELKASNVLQEMLDLYNKQQRIMKSQEKIIMEQEKEIDNYKKQEFGNLFNGRYISKDKVLKAMGYEENDEEYDRLKQDNEKLLAILDTMYSEFCRLEDIEDKKVEVAVAFIEEKRDKYWQDKIREFANSLITSKYCGNDGYIQGKNEESEEIGKELLELLEE